MSQRNDRTQVYGAIRVVTLVNVLTNLAQTNLEDAIGCQVFDFWSLPVGMGSHARSSHYSLVNRDGYISNLCAGFDAITDLCESKLLFVFSDYGILGDDTGLIAPNP